MPFETFSLGLRLAPQLTAKLLAVKERRGKREKVGRRKGGERREEQKKKMTVIHGVSAVEPLLCYKNHVDNESLLQVGNQGSEALESTQLVNSVEALTHR